MSKTRREYRDGGVSTKRDAVFDIKYHLCVTKYRYKILRGRVAERARDLVRQICEAREVVIVRGAVSPNHIHMLVSAPAQLRRRSWCSTSKAELATAAGGVSGAAEAVLGTALVGTAVLSHDGGRGG